MGNVFLCGGKFEENEKIISDGVDWEFENFVLPLGLGVSGNLILHEVGSTRKRFLNSDGTM